MMFDFQKLQVYIKAKIFYGACKKLTSDNRVERHVKDQLGRAAFSIVLNIAEGSGKISKRDRRNYFVTSRSSVFECVAILDTLHDDQVITSEQFPALMKQGDEISRMLYAMIKNLS